MKKIVYTIVACTALSFFITYFKPESSTDSVLEMNSVVDMSSDNDANEHQGVDTPSDNDTNEHQGVEVKSFQDLYERAEEVALEAFELNGTEKISFITKKVTTDITTELDKNIILDALSYLINEYEIEKFNLNAPVNLYITRLVDKQLDKYTDMVDADNMAFDMFQICKDIIRMTSDNMTETAHSISANQEQINKVIDSVKSGLK